MLPEREIFYGVLTESDSPSSLWRRVLVEAYLVRVLRGPGPCSKLKSGESGQLAGTSSSRNGPRRT